MKEKQMKGNLNLFAKEENCMICGSKDVDSELMVTVESTSYSGGSLNCYDCLCKDCYCSVINGIENIIQRRRNMREKILDKDGNVSKIKVTDEEGKFVKWEAFVDDKDFVMPFGKFKGSKITDIVKNESVYALWAVTNLSGSLKKRFERLMYN